MARYVTYRCPDCKGEFEFLHHPHDEPPPSHCQLCNSYMGAEPPKAPVIYLNIGTAKNKVGDKLYRELEESSIARAKEAAEMTGASEADMSAMKITNMPDNTRAGDNHAVSVTQAEKNLTREAMGHKIGPQMQNFNQTAAPQGQMTPEVAAMVESTTTGPNAMATRRMIHDIQSTGRASQMISQRTQAGTIARYDPKAG